MMVLRYFAGSRWVDIVQTHGVITSQKKSVYRPSYPKWQRALAESGFQWSGNAMLGWLEVIHAAAIYSKMHNRNLDIPYHFVVPASPYIDHDRSDDKTDSSITGSDDAWPWPGKDACV